MSRRSIEEFAGSVGYDFTWVDPVAVDNTLPRVSSFSPTDGASGVAVGSDMVLTFSEVIGRGKGVIELHSGSPTGPLVESFDAATSGRLTVAGHSLTVNPTVDLLGSTQYFVTFDPGTVKDLAGNSYAGSEAYHFVTASLAPMVGGSLESWEYLASWSDLMNWLATDADAAALHYNTYARAENRSISFDAWDYLASNPDLMDWLGADAVRATEHYILYGRNENRSFSFDAAAYLAANADLFNWLGTDYDAAAKHYIEHGRYEIEQGFRAPLPPLVDRTLPAIVSFNPFDAALGVAVDSNIVFTFSEAIEKGVGVIQIHSGSFTGPVVESYDVATSGNLTILGKQLTIDPSADLADVMHYFVTLDAGSVRDLAGNGCAASAMYDFSTVSGWDPRSGHGLLDLDRMLESATGKTIPDAALFGDGWGAKDWGLNMVHAPDAWGAGYSGKGVVVAVVDTGIDYRHPDLAGNIWTNAGEIAGNGIDDDGNGYIDDVHGYDFFNHDGDPVDEQSHGTVVAGIIAGLNNGVGVTGVACDARIMVVKVLGPLGGTFADVAAGINYAVNNGADVINLSLSSGGVSSSLMAAAISNALSHGVVVCMASGNAASSIPGYPALFAQTTGGIAVGAVNSSGSVAGFSNGAGDVVPYDFVVAPGVNVYSTFVGNYYGTMSGTSMATPYVAGAAALLLSAHADFSSDWTLDELENIISSSASPLDMSAASLEKESLADLNMADVAGFDAVGKPEGAEVSLVGIVV